MPRLQKFVLAFLGTFLSSSGMAAADDKAGELLYQRKCASCHGAKGEGSKHYRHILAGDRAVPQLAEQIQKTMPVDEPETLTAAESRDVAAYVHGAFYSRAARERNKTLAPELARLTVRQHRNALADLVAAFRWNGKWDDQRGLKAEYFKGRNFGGVILSRTDAQVSFDFGAASPVPDKIEPHEFSIRWAGAVLAPESGEYEIIIRTEHAARLWLNEQRQPLIDAWVKSGTDTEYRASIHLLAGRVYPLRLEYTKAKQGVDDSKKGEKPPSVKSSMALLWKKPGGVPEVIPNRCLSPNKFPETFVATTPFPPDDRSYGWERGTTVSKAWDEAATDAALETAGHITSRLNELAGTRDGAPDRAQKLRDFARRFLELAFRRPLTNEQVRLYLDRQFEAAKDPDLAVKRVVLLALKSPRFLYVEAGRAGNADGYDIAARLALGLWDALPDSPLREAAAAGKLATREQVTAQAERMLNDPRARTKLLGFFRHWLTIDHAPEIAKDPKRFPGFDAPLVADLRTSLEMFLEETIWSEKSDFRQLFTADQVHLNGRLARFYGVELPAAADFQKVNLNADKRAGILTHPYLMSLFAYTGESSPIHRGVFLTRGVLGLALRPPPEAVAPLAPDLHPNLTTRERVTMQTKPANCMTCHGVINPLGFTLENFDAVGRYRDTDKTKPVDATGSYQTRAGQKKTFASPKELAAFLVQNEEVHAAFVEQLFHHLVQQSVRAYGPKKGEELRASFAASGYNIRKLAVEVMVAAALQEKPRQTRAPFYPPGYAHISNLPRSSVRWQWKSIP